MEEIMAHPYKKILWAAENGNTELVSELLESDGYLVNSKDKDGYSPLHRAAYENHTGTSSLISTQVHTCLYIRCIFVQRCHNHCENFAKLQRLLLSQRCTPLKEFLINYCHKP